MTITSGCNQSCLKIAGAAAAGNVAAAAASGQPDTTIEHIDYRNKLTEIRNIYHQVSCFTPGCFTPIKCVLWKGHFGDLCKLVTEHKKC